MFVAWVVFHVIICIALILVVLMQSSKGEGLAGGTAFGGGVSTAVFGGRGAASFLSKATTVLAVVFFMNCGALALMSSNASRAIAVGSDETAPVESAVTERAQREQAEAMQRQQMQQEAAMEDSLARTGAEGTPAFNLDSLGMGDQGETAPDTSGN